MVIYCKEIQTKSNLTKILDLAQEHMTIIERQNKGLAIQVKLTSESTRETQQDTIKVSKVSNTGDITITYAGIKIAGVCNFTELMDLLKSTEPSKKITDAISITGGVNNVTVTLKKNNTGSLGIHNTKDTAGINLTREANKDKYNWTFDGFTKISVLTDLDIELKVGNYIQQIIVQGTIKQNEVFPISIKIGRKFQTSWVLFSTINLKYSNIEFTVDISKEQKLHIKIHNIVTITIDLPTLWNIFSIPNELWKLVTKIQLILNVDNALSTHTIGEQILECYTGGL